MKELITFRKYLNEGIINENINLDDTLDTPQELVDFIEEQIEPDSVFDKILDVRFPKLADDRSSVLFDAETVIYNQSPYSYDPEEIEEDWDEIKDTYYKGENPTKRDIFKGLLESLEGWYDIENYEEYEGEFKEKYNIDNDTFQEMFGEYLAEIYKNYEKLFSETLKFY